MADKYGWSLVRVQVNNDAVLEVDCVFDGYCEFPPSRMDLTQGEDLMEEEDA